MKKYFESGLITTSLMSGICLEKSVIFFRKRSARFLFYLALAVALDLRQLKFLIGRFRIVSVQKNLFNFTDFKSIFYTFIVNLFWQTDYFLPAIT